MIERYSAELTDSQISSGDSSAAGWPADDIWDDVFERRGECK